MSLGYSWNENYSFNYSNSFYNNSQREAKNYGINVNEYYTFNNNGMISGVDSIALNAAVKKAEKEEAQKIEEEDKYISTTKVEDKNLTEDDKAKATKYKNEVDREYKKALEAYANCIESAEFKEYDKELNDKWTEARAESLKYIGVDTSNTTVLEGAKEFINNILNLGKETKNAINKKNDEDTKASAISLESETEILDRENNIEVYQTFAEDNTNPFADVYMRSAMETFDVEEAEEDIFA